MSQWPATLPECPSWQYTEIVQPGSIRSNMDTGPAKIRARFTAVVQTFTVAMKLTSTQVDTLNSFYEDTVSFGTSAFDWQHPRTEEPASCRFVSRPVVTGLDRLYAVSFEIEIIPS